MKSEKHCDLDYFFGDYGLEVTLFDQIKTLIPDAVFVNDEGRYQTPEECMVGKWYRLRFYKDVDMTMVFWTQNQKADRMPQLKSLMKSAGCNTFYCNPYVNGEWRRSRRRAASLGL